MKLPFRPVARECFPAFFKKQTGLELAPGWEDPPLNSVTTPYINKMVSLGFEPQQLIADKYILTGISLPLLTSRLQLGGFLAAYKPPRSLEALRWVKYTHPELVAPETPLIAISGTFPQKPEGLLVNNLKDYFKLINWVYCQRYTYAKAKGASPPMIIYVDQGEDEAIEKMRQMQMQFTKLTDFSGRFTEEIKRKMLKDNRAFVVHRLQYFDENPLEYCKTRIDYENALMQAHTLVCPALRRAKNSFRRKTLP